MTPTNEFTLALAAAGLDSSLDFRMGALANVLQKTVAIGVHRIREGDLVDIAREANDWARDVDASKAVSVRGVRHALQALVATGVVLAEETNGTPSWAINLTRLRSQDATSTPASAPKPRVRQP